MEPKVIFEDDEFLVLEKPSGMVVNRAESVKESTVQDWAERKLSCEAGSRSAGKIQSVDWQDRGEKLQDFYGRAGIVHRLDKETSGLLLVAKTPEAFADLQRQFKERVVKKRYLTLVHGKVVPEEGEVRAPVGRLPWNREKFGVIAGGREAVTRYKVIHYYTMHSSPYTLLEAYPETGRTHQIRIHLKYLGHALVGDEAYAGRKTSHQDRTWCPRLFLHASYLGFQHPKKREWMEFESKLPQELQAMINKL